MTGNYFICENRVVVEGNNIGQFVSCNIEDSRDKFSGSAIIEIPFYSIAAKSTNVLGLSKKVGKNVITYERINAEAMGIKCGSRIEVYAKYRDNKALEQTFDELKIFDGYIRDVIGGFPTKLKCVDLLFPLHFGTVTHSWLKATPIKQILSDEKTGIIPVANKAFEKYRNDNGLKYKWPKLTVDGESADFNVPFRSSYLTSPFEIISSMIIGKMKLFGNARLENDEAMIFCGTARKQTDANTIKLSTAVNVIGRNLVPADAMFANYRVIVTYNAQNDKYSKAEVGSENGTPYELPYYGDKATEKEVMGYAQSALMGLKTNRNKGTITTLLYPKAQLFDYIDYEDTIFTKLSGGYAVIGYKLSCGKDGYHQELTVTNKTLMNIDK